jgi:hypothetical protein
VKALLRAWRQGNARSRRAAFCSIATEAYLPWTLVLFDAVARFNPRAPRVLLYVRSPGEAWRSPRIDGAQVIGVEDLADAAHEADLRRKYTLAELCFAFKPRLLRHCLDRHGERAYYLDSDLCILAPMEEAALALERASVVLTPHLDAPVPNDGKLPSELTVSRSGACNAGFIGVAESDEAREFLAWWDARVARYGYVAPEFGYQGDQKWLDLAPSLFPRVHLLRDPGSNVGSWNLHGRRIERSFGRAVANGRPLSFVHFSGFDPECPDVLSKYQNRIRLEDQPVLAGIARDYAGLLIDARARAAALEWEPGAAPAAQPGEATHDPAPMADEDYRATYEVEIPPGSYESGEEIPVRAVVTNASTRTWKVGRAPDGTGGIALSWHLRNQDGEVLAWENNRNYLPRDLAPGASVEMRIGIKAMLVPGRYILELDLVHEGVAWFLLKGSAAPRVMVFVGLFDA